MVLHRSDQIGEVFDDGRVGMVIGEGAVTVGEEHRRQRANPCEDALCNERGDTVSAVGDDAKWARKRSDQRHNVVDVGIDHVLGLYGANPAGRRTVHHQLVQSLDAIAV